MIKNVVIFILIVNSIKISAQTEIQKLSDTSKFLFDLKPATPINNNFNLLINPFPAKLTANHTNIYHSIKDTLQRDSLNMPHEQKINPELLFVRSAYFSPDSKLFKFKKQSFGLLSDEELGKKLSLEIVKTYKEKYGNVSSGRRSGGISIGIPTKEERMKERAEKRKKAYVY
ncbi:MAG: hypothetical protein LBP85_03935 [Prevotellaceae bacterium]|jgi:hypothetical protein|nr:hypothetical protein [Prevotellaceae bacterium]